MKLGENREKIGGNERQGVVGRGKQVMNKERVQVKRKSNETGSRVKLEAESITSQTKVEGERNK